MQIFCFYDINIGKCVDQNNVDATQSAEVLDFTYLKSSLEWKALKALFC